jgi:AcrR family transcriptional regulator
MGAREAILTAADRMFGEMGFDVASTREIAELSGVNKALIHYHFKNKETLLASVLDQYYEKLSVALLPALAGGGSLRERLERLVGAYVDFLGDNPRFCRIVQREASGGKNAALIQQRMIPLFQLGRDLLAQGYPVTASGDLAAEHLLVSVYGMIITYFTYSDVLTPLMGADPLSAAHLATRKRHILRIVDILLAAIETEDRTDG